VEGNDEGPEREADIRYLLHYSWTKSVDCGDHKILESPWMTHKVPVSTAMSRIHLAFIIEAVDWIMSHIKREIR
jgi:hypothetical protein